MMKVDMLSDINIPKLSREIDDRRQRGIMVGASEFRRFAQPYVRFQTGFLSKSAYYASDLKRGLVVYDAPYARRTYYDTKSKVTTDHNPQARPLWGDTVKDRHLDAIRKAMETEMKK